MNDLVLIKPIGSKLEPYTTADKVAAYAEVQPGTREERARRNTRRKEGAP